MRRFEKISVNEFKKEGFNDLEAYNDLKIPHRGSKFSAGYDFATAWKTTLPAGETVKIPTLIKADMDNDDVLLIVVRSSLGFKHNVRLANTVAVVDKDYYRK